MPWEKVTLVGVGLLGGSLGRALREDPAGEGPLARSVVGLVRREATIREAIDCGAVDQATLDPEEAVSSADLVVLCTPLEAMRSLLERLLPYLKEGALVTDVGSVKGLVSDELEGVLAAHSAEFVGSHPMAGSDKGGVSESSAGLFKDAVCVVTPTSSSSQSAVSRIVQLWEDVGARVMILDPATHDELVSRCSHLPHVLSVLLARHVLGAGADSRLGTLCAGGFRDTTRIAAGDVTMWKDILTQNRARVIAALDEYLAELSALRDILVKRDDEKLEQILSDARKRRLNWRKEMREAGRVDLVRPKSS